MMKKSSFGSRVKKRLSDITNMHSQPKSPLKDQENVLPVIDDSSTNKYVEKLVKENAMMMKLIQEKDKIIESNGLELQKLRFNLKRTQLQNWHLAQSNTQMLAELNMCKDKLKTLQHDIGCKDALYKANMLDLQEKAKVQCQENSMPGEETKTEKVAEDRPNKQANNNNENKVFKTKRGRPMSSQSLGDPSSQQVDKAVAENKRRCLIRQSVRLKPQETRADLFELDVNSPLPESFEQPLHESNSESQEYCEWREEKANMLCEENSMLEEKTKPEKADMNQSKQAGDTNENKVSETTIGRATRSHSHSSAILSALGAESSEQAVDEEIAENKRRCLRRQSVRLRPQEKQADMFEIVVKTSLPESFEQPLHASHSESQEICEWRVDKPKTQCEEKSMLEEETKPEKADMEESKQADDMNENKVSKTTTGRATRSQSLGTTSSQHAGDKEIVENKRRCLRRQSVRLEPQETQAYLVEINVNTPLTALFEKPLLASTLEREDDKESSKLSLPQRPSLARPSRKAAGKIQSYKDPPLNKKMRRP